MVAHVDVDRPAGGTANRRIDRGSIVELVADQLRELIIDGNLAPGDRIQDSLAGEFGVSRNTLRESCRLLMHERLLVQEFNKGIFVARPTRADLVDVFRVRRLIECAALRAAADVPPAAAATVTDAIAKGEKAAAEADWSAVGTANVEFHRAVAGLSGSERISEHMRQVLAELRLVFHAMEDAKQFYEPYLPRNAEIAKTLLENKKPATAEALLFEYLADAERQLLEAFPD